MSTAEKKLSAWQLAMLALGTVVGGSFFLGSALAIKAAGPGVIISYLVGGFLVYLILYALSEMTVANPAPGSFRTYAEQMYGPMMGFLIGWIYWTGLVLAMSSEAIAVSILLNVWFPDISLPVTGSIIIIIVTLVNLLGIDKLSRLESSLASIKLLAIIGFIITAVLLIAGLLPGRIPIGTGALANENLFPAGIGGIAGSMLIVMFTFAGFEVIGLAASEAKEPHRTIPRAILYTVLALVGLYLTAVTMLLPLIPTSLLTEEVSPMVSALTRSGLVWAGDIINIVLVTAIISTMLAATFGIARMIYSLAVEGHAPVWLRDKGSIPYRGILFSGTAMLAALGLGFILPEQVYLFLVSSGGFSLLFSYLIIMITHYKYRRIHGCPPVGKCQFPGYPFTSWLSIAIIVIIIMSMPIIAGQGSGLIAGILLIFFYLILYILKTKISSVKKGMGLINKRFITQEFSEEISQPLKVNRKKTTPKNILSVKNKFTPPDDIEYDYDEDYDFDFDDDEDYDYDEDGDYDYDHDEDENEDYDEDFDYIDEDKNLT